VDGQVQDDLRPHDDHVAHPGGRDLNLAQHKPDGEDINIHRVGRASYVKGLGVGEGDQRHQGDDGEGLLQARTWETPDHGPDNPISQAPQEQVDGDAKLVLLALR